eukprot:sb/3478549/
MLMGGSIFSGKNAKCSESQSLLPTTNLSNSDPVHSHFKTCGLAMIAQEFTESVIKAGFALAMTQGLPWIIHAGVLQDEVAAQIMQYLFLVTFGLQVNTGP